MSFTCPFNSVVTGFQSEHSNSHEDRRWKLRCSRKNGMVTTHEYLTPYVNNWDSSMNYYVPNDYYIRGMHGYHDNSKEDRLYRFDLCKVNLGIRG
ncbi:hemagglutinin/amebocyte aggregation factor-like [Branchiostoma floridae x Branchiostoma japonicum]